MAEVDFSDPKPGFKRQLYDSPWCTACEAKNHQWCQHNDIVPHATMGTGWKNVGEKGCETGKCKAICGKDFNETGHKHTCCLGQPPSGNEIQYCHPAWRTHNSPDCKDILVNETNKFLISGKQIAEITYPNLKKWIEDPANHSEYEGLKRGVCSLSGANAATNSICDIWCNQNPAACYQGRMNWCAIADNINSEKCQQWKEVAQNARFDITTYLNSEEKWCQAGGEDRMRSGRCVAWASDPKIIQLARSTKIRYDGWWNKWCDQVHIYADSKPGEPNLSTWKPKDRADLGLAVSQCSCTLKPGIKPNDPTTLLSNPYCFNPVCMNRPEAYKTIGRLDDTRTCPNVCANIINNTAGRTGIINNINIIQNCFNANGQNDVRNTVRGIIEQDLKENILSMLKTYIICREPYSENFKDFLAKNKPDLKPWHDTIDIIARVEGQSDEYHDIRSYTIYMEFTEVMAAFKVQLPEIRRAYVAVISMEWPASVDKDVLEKQFMQLTSVFKNLLQGRKDEMDEILEDGKKILKFYEELVAERIKLAKEARLHVSDLQAEYDRMLLKYDKLPNPIKEKIKNVLPDIKGSIDSISLSFLEGIRNNELLRTQVLTLKKTTDALLIRLTAFNSVIEEAVGGTVEERANAMKLVFDKEIGIINTKFGRVADLGRDGKLSERDKNQFVSLSTDKRGIDTGALSFANIYTTKPINLISLTEIRDTTMNEIGKLTPLLDAIQEFNRTTPPPPPPGTTPPPPPSPPGDNTWLYLIAGALGIFILILSIYLYKR